MDLGLRGSRALITGGSRGIGFAVADALAAEGAAVGLIARDAGYSAGADMLGTVEFNSACYYRYVAVDLAKLVENLRGDTQLALKGVEAFLRASIYAVPTGKQNTFAAHNPPGFIAFTVREHASPRSLANAFERAVRPGETGLTAASAAALAKEWAKLEQVFGQGGQTVYVNATEGEVRELPGEAVPTVETLIQRTIQYVQALAVA